MSQTEFIDISHTNGQTVPTYCTSTDYRHNQEEIARQVDRLNGNDVLMTAFDAVPVTLLILNDLRQIIGVNSLTREQFGDAFSQVFGKRPGEAFGCMHGAAGCGTTRACSSCGAMQAIVECIGSGDKKSHECSMQTHGADGTIQCLDLRVTVSRFLVDGKSYYSAILEDIAQTKRLEVFQQLFFHDILNTIGCIKGYVDIIQYAETPKLHVDSDDEESYILRYLEQLCTQLSDEVNSHRELLSAENGELVVQNETVRTFELLQALATRYQSHEIGQGHLITVAHACNKTVVTDRMLLTRILGNMLKNAIEASPPGSRVTLQCFEENGQTVFCVNNPGVIPEEVQYQIFKRSFSTKQKTGRGIGTYSMRLFGEKYIGGKVDFTSHPADGTTFRLRIPTQNGE